MKNLFFPILIILVFFACNGDVENSSDASKDTGPYTSAEGVSTNGYKFKHHIKRDGIKPKEGYEVRYHEIVFKNDSLVKSSHYAFEPILAIMPPLSQVASPPPPNYDAVMMMSAGDSMTIVHDLDTVSTASLPKWLTNNDELRYEIKLLSIRTKEEIEESLSAVIAREKTVGDSLRMRMSLFKQGKLNNEIITSESGLKYIIHNPGDKNFPVEEGKFVQVHYMGCLTENGVSFNNSFAAARPFPFQIGRGRVIKGWDEGIMKLNKGGSMTMFVPYELGYGVAGKPGEEGKEALIPEKAELAFYVELINIR